MRDDVAGADDVDHSVALKAHGAVGFDPVERAVDRRQARWWTERRADRMARASQAWAKQAGSDRAPAREQAREARPAGEGLRRDGGMGQGGGLAPWNLWLRPD